MKGWRKLRIVSCVLFLTLVLAVPVLWGCRYIAMFGNSEVSIAGLTAQSRIIAPYGEAFHGALDAGTDSLRIYTDLEEPGNSLQVFDPSGPGWTSLNDTNTSTIAALIRDFYAEIHPGGDPSVLNVNIDNSDPTSPIFEMELFLDPGGAGTLHTIQLKGHRANGAASMRIAIDGGAGGYENIEAVGRKMVVREADAEDTSVPAVTIVTSLSRDQETQPTVGTDPTFEIQTNVELGMVMAFAVPNSSVDTDCPALTLDDCYDGGGVPVVVSFITKDPTSTPPIWTYQLKVAPGNVLESGTQYLLALATAMVDEPGKYHLLPPARYQKASQDLNGHLLRDNLTPFNSAPDCRTGCSATEFTGNSDNSYMNILPYFFTTN